MDVASLVSFAIRFPLEHRRRICRNQPSLVSGRVLYAIGGVDPEKQEITRTQFYHADAIQLDEDIHIEQHWEFYVREKRIVKPQGVLF